MVLLTSLTETEIRQIFRQEIENYFAKTRTQKDNAPATREFLTLPEAADFLRVQPQTMYGYVHRKQIKHSKRGKLLYFKKDDLIDFISSGKRQTLSEITAQAERQMIEANS